MNMTDPIADMLTRVRNAIRADHETVEVPCSKVKCEIARILKEENYIADYTVVGEAAKDKKIIITFSIPNWDCYFQVIIVKRAVSTYSQAFAPYRVQSIDVYGNRNCRVQKTQTYKN